MKTRNIQNYLILGAFLLLVISSCNQQADSPVVQIQFDQIEFEKARNEFYKSYDNAPNEIKKSAIFIESRMHTCEFEKKHGRNFTDWSGVVDKIITDQGGDEVSFTITSESQGRTIYYEESAIKQGTSLYNEIAELKEGDNIYFTFKFNEESVFSTNEKECFDEISFTESGSLEEPEFSVSFSNIKKLK